MGCKGIVASFRRPVRGDRCGPLVERRNRLDQLVDGRLSTEVKRRSAADVSVSPRHASAFASSETSVSLRGWSGRIMSPVSSVGRRPVGALAVGFRRPPRLQRQSPAVIGAVHQIEVLSVSMCVA